MAKLAQNKTQPTTLKVEEFIDNIPDEQKKADSLVIFKLMKKAIKDKPKVWSNSLIGFGDIIVKSPTSGREAQWFTIGFSPRKTNLTVYLPGGMTRYSELLKNLGKHKTGGGCLYITKLADIDLKVLEQIINKAVKEKW